MASVKFPFVGLGQSIATHRLPLVVLLHAPARQSSMLQTVAASSWSRLEIEFARLRRRRTVTAEGWRWVEDVRLSMGPGAERLSRERGIPEGWSRGRSGKLLGEERSGEQQKSRHEGHLACMVCRSGSVIELGDQEVMPRRQASVTSGRTHEREERVRHHAYPRTAECRSGASCRSHCQAVEAGWSCVSSTHTYSSLLTFPISSIHISSAPVKTSKQNVVDLHEYRRDLSHHHGQRRLTSQAELVEWPEHGRPEPPAGQEISTSPLVLGFSPFTRCVLLLTRQCSGRPC